VNDEYNEIVVTGSYDTDRSSYLAQPRSLSKSDEICFSVRGPCIKIVSSYGDRYLVQKGDVQLFFTPSSLSPKEFSH